MNAVFRRALGALGLIALPLLLHASAGPVDPAASTISATFRQMNVPVEGRFTRFSGRVDYRAAEPGASSAELEIDTASFDLGLDDYNAEVRKPEWFDSARHPVARFSATGLQPQGDGRFRVRGTLTLKGQTHPLIATLTLSQTEGLNFFEGEVPVSRKRYGLGDAGWDGVLDDEVIVRFRIAQPQ
ncbi:MAG: YceI family protein [Gammaproteobacteria bacterium]|jgi:polyisoprenoid-binding protein YceI